MKVFVRSESNLDVERRESFWDFQKFLNEKYQATWFNCFFISYFINVIIPTIEFVNSCNSKTFFELFGYHWDQCLENFDFQEALPVGRKEKVVQLFCC